MQDKKHDDFFDEENESKNAEVELLKMIDEQDDTPIENVEAGDKVHGTVVKIGSTHVLVDINAKHEAMISLSEVSDKDGALTLNVGDEIDAYVVSTTNDEIILSKSLKLQKGSSLELVEAMKNKLPVQGKVTGVNKGGYNVNIMGVRAFCPMSHIDTAFVEDPNVHLSKTYTFMISKITDGGKNVVVSRLPILQKDVDKTIDEIAENIDQKKVYTGTISRIADFGLFVDLGGFDGLVHVSEVSWDRTDNLKDIFTVGQKVDCVVLKLERGNSIRDTKISLSIKQASDNPWKDVLDNFSVGNSYDGKIVRIVNFGAFVQLQPGIEGLIHVSEMSWDKRVRHPSDIVSVGDDVRVTVLGIDPEKHTISCSLKDVKDDPWANITERFPAGSKATGKVASKTKFGFFIDFDKGITGLLVFNNIAKDKKDSIKIGDDIEVTIDGIDTDRRRMSLSYGKVESSDNAEDVKAYVANTKKQKSSKSTSSEFGEMLKAALNK